MGEFEVVMNSSGLRESAIVNRECMSLRLNTRNENH